MENKKIDMKTGNEKAEDSIPGNRCINEAVLPGKQKEKTGEDRYKIWDIQDLSACGCSLRSAFSAGSLRLQWRQCEAGDS